ncbi:MAG: hypothetical protein A3G38_02045 [Omnitrophica WOR_2 bacterium RIFCSPLOWO2_12_FULL_51_8]|nr:MAG: hypothetical protein A3G38_02045 [Omnitrophica WOR_2 bacterium RIFCSPLOWO2_12_FULL_51_8]
MFNYFHQNKFNYEKGQLTPIFIVILVVVLIMAFVTLNLSKVAFIKTDTANAADAGALAAGSMMANIFNATAKANSGMEKAFREFYAVTLITLVAATVFLVAGKLALTPSYASASAALSQAFPSPCTAKVKAWAAATKELVAKNFLTKLYFTLINGLIVSIPFFAVSQEYFYFSIRDQARQGRLEAFKIGHKLAFVNSGIGAKLKEAKVPDDEELEVLMDRIMERLLAKLILQDSALKDDPDLRQKVKEDPSIEERFKIKEKIRNNYRKEFSNFLEHIAEAEDYTYAWIDGEGRDHAVQVKIKINPLDKFVLRTTLLPWPAIVTMLNTTTNFFFNFLYAAAAGLLLGACACQNCCGSPFAPFCCTCWGVLSGIAAALMGVGIVSNLITIYKVGTALVVIAAVSGGLLPLATHTLAGDEEDWSLIIAWIDKIDHDHRVFVETWQRHEGRELGLWQTRYPQTYSSSTVDFSGEGKIYPPVANFNPSIIATDNDQSQSNSYITGVVVRLKDQSAQLQSQLTATRSQIEFLQGEIKRFRALIASLGAAEEAKDLEGQVKDLEEQIKSLEESETKATTELENIAQGIQDYKKNFPDLLGKN